MTIHEPATLATDYALAAVAGWLALRLRTHTRPEHHAARWWMWTLALTAASSFVGGNYHGFSPNFSANVAKPWWLITLWLVSLISAAMTISWIHEIVCAPWRKIAFALVATKLIVFAAIAVARPSFTVVILDYGSSLLLWLGASIVLRRGWSAWMLGGIALSVVAALVQLLRLAPAPWFNHNDLYHVIQALGLAAFYRAALRMVSPVAAR
jgi:hypothetical protein